MGRLLGPFDPPPPRRTARDIQGEPPRNHYYPVGPRGSGAFIVTTADFPGERVALVDLDAGEYKDITDGRSAGDPSGGT